MFVKENEDSPKEDLVRVLARADLGRLSVEKFEQWIYANDSLSSLVGADDYSSLLEMDYRQKYSLMEACSILRKHVEQGAIELAKAKQLLLAAGAALDSVYPAQELLGADSQLDASVCCSQIIARFGGLHIKEEMAKSDVCFWQSKEVDSLVEPWSNRVGPLCTIGSAQCDYTTLYIGQGAELYFLANTVSQLYELGPFWDGLVSLLFGDDRDFGVLVPR